MSSRSRLYTRSRVQDTTSDTKQINLVIFDINVDPTSINRPIVKVKVFNEAETDLWFDYITSGLTNIYLFTSNILSNTFIQFIHDYPQITSIYIFRKDQQYRDYCRTQTKVQGVYDDVDIMITQFHNDINNIFKNKHFSEEKTFTNIDPESAEVLWWGVFDRILQHITHTNIAKDEFTTLCRERCQDNKHELQQISEFEHDYESDQVIRWYTRDGFLYRTVNKMLRTKQNINNIFKLRLFITDLVSELRAVQSVQHEKIPDPLIVYRGQGMSRREIEQLKSNVGKSILINQFLSTSPSREVARIFVEGYPDESPLQGVLIQIRIEPFSIENGSVPFADISTYSVYSDEREVLFSAHSTFSIESVQLDNDNIWLINLKYIENTWDADFDQRSIFTPHADQIFIRHLSKENKQFIAFQLLLDTILRLDQTNYAKEELLEFCKSKYQHDTTTLQQIDRFENTYRSEDAGRWYTKDCFLYRLLNESLRTEIIDCIVKMRYFIHDLHNHLAELQPSFIQSLCGEKSIILYRGQPMNMAELNEMRDNHGGYISMNSFISATQDNLVARFFSGEGQTTEPNQVSVIYEMLIDTDIRSTPYAKTASFIADEEEILFSMGAVFQIGDIDELDDQIYRVKLTMVHREDDLWNRLTGHLNA